MFGYVITISAFALYVLVSYFTFRFTVGRDFIRCYRRVWTLLLVTGAGFTVLFACLLMHSHTAYYWDSCGYWTRCCQLRLGIYEDPAGWMQKVYKSILDKDYNDILPLILAFPLTVCGYSFRHYVIANAVCFLLPAQLLFAACALKVAEPDSAWAPARQDDKQTPPEKQGRIAPLHADLLLLCVLTMTFNALPQAMLYGYIDVVCLVPAALAVLLTCDFNACSLDRRQILRDLLLSLQLLLCFLFRRYFAYFIIGYAAALICLCAVQARAAIRRGECTLRQAAGRSLINLIVIAGAAVSVLFLFFSGLINHIFSNNYFAQYAAYNAPLPDKLLYIVRVFGAAAILLCAAGTVISLIRKRFRRLTFAGLIMGTVTSTSFFSVQAMGIQHIYVLALPVFLLVVNAIWQIREMISERKLRQLPGRVCTAAMIAFFALGTIHCYAAPIRKYLSPVKFLFTRSWDPPVRNDLDELKRLKVYLNVHTIGSSKHVYILASSNVLNDSLLNSLERPQVNQALFNYRSSSHVDMRDGFSENFLGADYVVTTTPIQLHLKKGTQEVVRYLAEQVMDPYSCIGRHYEDTGVTFELDGSVNDYLEDQVRANHRESIVKDGHVIVHIYRKISEYSRYDLEEIAKHFSHRYPGCDSMFANRILGYSPANPSGSWRKSFRHLR